MIKSEILREVMLENREEVMRHEVIKRRMSLDGFDRQVLVGARRAGKSYILYGKIQELIAAGYSWDEIVYVNFEDERLADMTVDDLNMILEVHSGLVHRAYIVPKPNLYDFQKLRRCQMCKKYMRFGTLM